MYIVFDKPLSILATSPPFVKLENGRGWSVNCGALRRPDGYQVLRISAEDIRQHDSK